jgi:hypothetical protein
MYNMFMGVYMYMYKRALVCNYGKASLLWVLTPASTRYGLWKNTACEAHSAGSTIVAAIIVP